MTGDCTSCNTDSARCTNNPSNYTTKNATEKTLDPCPTCLFWVVNIAVDDWMDWGRQWHRHCCVQVVHQGRGSHQFLSPQMAESLDLSTSSVGRIILPCPFATHKEGDEHSLCVLVKTPGGICKYAHRLDPSPLERRRWERMCCLELLYLPAAVKLEMIEQVCQEFGRVARLKRYSLDVPVLAIPTSIRRGFFTARQAPSTLQTYQAAHILFHEPSHAHLAVTLLHQRPFQGFPMSVVQARVLSVMCPQSGKGKNPVGGHRGGAIKNRSLQHGCQEEASTFLRTSLYGHMMKTAELVCLFHP